MTPGLTQTKAMGWIIVVAAAIFVLDLVTPRGIAVPMLYVLPILFTRYIPGWWSTAFLTGGVVLLSWLGIMPDLEEVRLVVVGNQAMISVLLLVVAGLLLKEKHLAQQRTKDQVDLRESEERYALVVAGAGGAIWDWNVLEKRMLFSPRWKALRGLAGDEVSDHETEWSSRIHSDDKERVMAAVRDHFAGRTAVFSEEYRVRHKNGRWIWILDHGIAKRDGAGNVVRMAGSEIDITERKEAEQALQESEARFRTMAEAVPSFLFETDAEGWNIWTSEGWCRFTGQTLHQVSGPGWAEALHRDDRAANVDRWMQCMQDGVPFESQQRLRRSDGVYVWVMARALPVRDSHGKVTRWVGSVTNVEDIVRAQEALRESEERLRLFIEHAPSALAMCDRNMRYLLVSQRWMEDYGLSGSPITIIGQSHYDVFPEIPDRWKDVHQRGLAGEVVREAEDRFKRADGSVQWLRWEVRPWRLSDGQVGGIVMFTEDITERKESEERLRLLNESLEARVRERTAALAEANERWDWVVRATNDGVWDWDLVHDTVYFSPRWKEMHGFQGSDRTESTKEWLARIHREDRPRVLEALERCHAGKGSQFHEEYRVQKKGGIYVWVLDRGIAVFNDEGRAIRMIGAETDITWRKEAEMLLREREAQLRELSARLLRAQEEERRRISRDLHDDVMQRMGALTLDLYGLGSSAASSDGKLLAQLKACGASAEQLTTDLQRLAHQLHPSVLEYGGLEAAVCEHVNEFAARTGVTVEFVARDVPKGLPLEHATCLYRVMQEGLQNVQRHADANTVLVRLLGTGRGLGLCVHDDGHGFEEINGAARRRGLGLTSMAERVGMLRGTFRVKTKPGAGTELHAWVPLENVKPDARTMASDGARQRSGLHHTEPEA
jgi:PAS domain S-box-containing protein